ncbi:DNA-directed RNA polymerase subunit alpha [Planctomycetales bacterium]|nr:DNA-directed RNA polymerase subunit alpha [Planctomycetales bacterium]GHT37069.1 DNA-directed RNA polymerase subunit alpha [Planctomycetales bacterium]
MGTRVPLNKTYLEQKERMRKLELSIAELGLSVRTTNGLDEQGISTIGGLLSRRREDLLKIPNFGEKTIEDIYNALEKLGFTRKNKCDD